MTAAEMMDILCQLRSESDQIIADLRAARRDYEMAIMLEDDWNWEEIQSIAAGTWAP